MVTDLGLFQFHKGAIRTYQATCRGISLSYFNSIKVRLEQIEEIPNLTKPIFQFHKGAIRTVFWTYKLLN